MVVNHLLNIGTDELSQREWRKLFSKLRYTDGDGVVYEPWQVYPHKHVARIPRGAWNLLPNHIEYVDRRACPEGRALDFIGTLDQTTKDGRTFEGQKEAVRKMLEQEQGLVIRPPGTGKTEIVVAFLCLVETPSLVLVHTEDILQQWIERIQRLAPDADVGVIRGKEFHHGDITVTTVQTFRRELAIRGNKLRNLYGAVVLDEAHHAAAKTFEEILNQMPAKYRIGVTASQTRADKKHPYMKTVMGPVIYKMKFKSKLPIKCVPVKRHRFYYGFRGPWDWGGLVDSLVSDPRRNADIARIADREISRGHSTLILSRRIDHLLNISELMALNEHLDYEILAARLMTKLERKDAIARFRSGELKCLLATQLADEALDVPILSRIILTFPGKHGGRLVQQIGRAIREYPGKQKVLVFDVVDDRVPVLRRQWMERKRAYRQMGIPIKKRKVK